MTRAEAKQWRKVKKQALIRDEIKCVVCAERKRLQVHHINCWRYFPNERFTLSNLVTLCRGCHTVIHTSYKYSYRYKTTRKDWENFLELAKYFLDKKDNDANR